MAGYTVISLFYNQHERLPMLKRAWEAQTVKPDEIIIVDDGSDDPVVVDWARVIRLPHTMNIARASNAGVDACKSEYYVITAPDIIYTPNFAEVSLRLLTTTPGAGKIAFFGRCGDTTSESNLPPLKAVGPVEGWPQQSPGAWMHWKKGFLRYDEAYFGWGRYDDDYVSRFIKSGGKYAPCNEFGMWHLGHLNEPLCKKRGEKQLWEFKANENENNRRFGLINCMPEGYTVISLFYNQHERLDILKRWITDQVLKPKEIIILDDGSDDPVKVPWARVIRFPHTMNIAHMSNVGVSEVKTKFFVITSPDLLYSPNFASKSIEILEKNPGMYVVVGGCVPCLDSVIYMANPPKSVYHAKEGIYSQHPADYAPTGWIERVGNFIGFNEKALGWGYYDNEYSNRYVAKGGKYIVCNDICMYHLNHCAEPKCPRRMRDEVKFRVDDRNLYLIQGDHKDAKD